MAGDEERITEGATQEMPRVLFGEKNVTAFAEQQKESERKRIVLGMLPLINRFQDEMGRMYIEEVLRQGEEMGNDPEIIRDLEQPGSRFTAIRSAAHYIAGGLGLRMGLDSIFTGHVLVQGQCVTTKELDSHELRGMVGGSELQDGSLVMIWRMPIDMMHPPSKGFTSETIQRGEVRVVRDRDHQNELWKQMLKEIGEGAHKSRIRLD